jgi:TonB family protein
MQAQRSDDTGEKSSAPDRAKSFLAYGIAVCVALHLAALPLVRASPTPAQEPPPDIVVVSQRQTPPPAPVPTPTPTPTPAPRVTPPLHARTAPPRSAQMRINPPAQTAMRRGGAVEHPNAFATGSPDGTPGDVTTAPDSGRDVTGTPATTPTPLPTPSPLACGRPDVASATLSAAEPEMPALAQQQGISGTVEVIVSLDAASRVVATRVRSSPSGVLNAAAVAAARASLFRTEVRDCAPISADYVFRVDFSGA